MSDLEVVVNKLRKVVGEDRVFQANEAPTVQVISTGSVTLDFATGLGGIPRGVVVELYGPESIGKTTLSYYMMAEQQKCGLKCGFINLEGRFNPQWAVQLCDFDPKACLVVAPEPGYQAVETFTIMVNSGKFGMVVLDSIGAMAHDKELEADGKIQVGGVAGLVTSMCNRTMAHARENGTTIVYINQLRDTLDSMYANVHTPGGKAVKYASTLRIHLKPTKDKYTGVVNNVEKEIGRRVSAIVEKNKLGPPKTAATWNFFFEQVEGQPLGIDRVGELIDLAMRLGTIEQNGKYYSHLTFPLDNNDKNRIVSKDGVREYLKANPEAMAVVREEIITKARERLQKK